VEDNIPASEFQERIVRLRTGVIEAGLAGFVSFGDCWRGANVCYFTEFRPLDGVSDIANAIFFLGADAEVGPMLFVSKQCVAYAAEATTFDVFAFDEMAGILEGFAKGRTGTLGLAGEAYIPAALHQRIKASVGDLRLEPHPLLAEIKAVKSEREVGLIRKASYLTDQAMEAIKETLCDGKPHTERELARIADMRMLALGADRTGYDSMVQAGPRSAFNLARPTDRVLQDGDLVMTDIGARYRGYVADGGRGFGYGNISPQKKEIIRAATQAVEAGLQQGRPGMTASDLNALMQEALVTAGYEEYSSEARGHGTGHGTGMDPEEEAPWIGPGNKTVLKENMVFTLKATITVPGVGGLRTERIVRVSATGIEPLDVYPMELYW
jgi:Xaa-Pro aminopeptidase